MRVSPGALTSLIQKYSCPIGWSERYVGDLAQVVGGATPDRADASCWTGGTLPWATPTDITACSGKWLNDTAERITPKGLESCSSNLLPSGTILYTSRATIGAKAIAVQPTATNQGFASFLPKAGTHGDFLYYLLDLLTPTFIRLGAGTTFLEVTKRDIRKVRCFVPPPAEQAAIARILDAADAAIARTRTAIQKARRVKRGIMQSILPPWVGFKRIDAAALGSGIEDVVPASVVARICNGSTPSRDRAEYWRSGTIPWLATGKVNERTIRQASEFVTEKALAECSIELLPEGAVLVGMIGQGKTRGMVAYLTFSACINQNFGAFLPGPRLHGRWLYHYLDFYYSQLREIGGGTNQGAMNCFLLGSITPTDALHYIAYRGYGLR